MSVARNLVAASCALLLALPAAAPAHAARGPKSEIDKAIGRCVASVLIGGLVGAAIGNNTGRGNAGRGAALGAAAGGAVCVVLLKVAKDKQALMDYQREQVAQGGLQRATFTGREGAPVTLVTQTREAQLDAPESAEPRVCRYADSKVELGDDQQADLGSQLYCRSDNGDWAIALAAVFGRG